MVMVKKKIVVPAKKAAKKKAAPSLIGVKIGRLSKQKYGRAAWIYWLEKNRSLKLTDEGLVEKLREDFADSPKIDLFEVARVVSNRWYYNQGRLGKAPAEPSRAFDADGRPVVSWADVDGEKLRREKADEKIIRLQARVDRMTEAEAQRRTFVMGKNGWTSNDFRGKVIGKKSTAPAVQSKKKIVKKKSPVPKRSTKKTAKKKARK